MCICDVGWLSRFGVWWFIQLLAVPVETEVRVYQRGTWECVATLADSAHIEVSSAHIQVTCIMCCTEDGSSLST